MPTCETETLGISFEGICSETDLPLGVRTSVEIILKMTRQVKGKDLLQWFSTGRVVHAEQSGSLSFRKRVGVELLNYGTMEQSESRTNDSLFPRRPNSRSRASW
jgi:hypothetical protein